MPLNLLTSNKNILHPERAWEAILQEEAISSDRKILPEKV
jgi:hypothetical protein